METIDFSQPPMLRDRGAPDDALILRPHSLDDADAVLERCLDPTTIAWTTVPLGYTREMAVDYLERMLSGEETTWSWALDSGGAYAGTLDLRFSGVGDPEALAQAREFHETFGKAAPVPTASLGFVVHPSFRGRGLMGRAVRLAVDEVFRRGMVDRVLWEAAAGNIGSWKSVEAAGFPPYTDAPALVSDHGIRVDGWRSVLTRDAWAARR